MRTKLALVFTLAFVLPAQAQDDRRHVPVPGASALNDELQQLWTRYEQSISDAAVYERWNVRPLRPLVPDANGEVLVATLTRVNYTVGESFTPRGDIWVTGVPEVQTICRGFRGDVQMQLRELIGLPPDQDISHAVVFRAHLTDIFRPAPWPDTSTQWPCESATATNCGNSFPPNADPAHIQWIATANLALHTVPNGYPWTHLGYTYDWAPGADRYGASEYIISKKAAYPVYVVSNVSPAEYCAPAPAP
jgi:hypothetical protein